MDKSATMRLGVARTLALAVSLDMVAVTVSGCWLGLASTPRPDGFEEWPKRALVASHSCARPAAPPDARPVHNCGLVAAGGPGAGQLPP
jgi:hypothetical protein